jgi:nucleotide-binding universal stress UspA family protein
MILIGYDGSADSQAAIDSSASLMGGNEATVLVVWETVLETMTRNGTLAMGLGMVGGFDDGETDAVLEKAALDTAADGAQRAAAAGLVAQPRIAGHQGDIADVILAVAADLDADAIVLGTRGLSGVKSLMLGSVSHRVVHHADRAVLIVPSSGLAEQRHRWANHMQGTSGP